MTFERFIARRYLFSGQHKALVSLITVISIAGVALGVYALLVVIAVMEGFDANLQEKIIGANAHIEVSRAYSNSPAITTASLQQIRKLPEVKGAGPVLVRYALLQVPGEGNEARQTGVIVQGLDLDEEEKITSIMSNVMGKKKPSPDEIVLGDSLASPTLYILPGQELRLLAPVFAETAGGRTPLVRSVMLAGTFKTGFPETDGLYGYVSLEGFQRLFMVPEGQIDGFRVMVENPNQVDRVARDIRQLLGPYVNVTTWQTRNEVLFHALQLEKWAMFIILLLIVLVAAFNIIGTLTMVVMEKTREIGILKSMGATEGAIMRIFLNQGMIIGGVGTAIGASFGLFTCYLLKYHIRLPQVTAAYLSDHIPVLVNPIMVILIVGSALLICLLASLYPARQAARLDPVEALRYE